MDPQLLCLRWNNHQTNLVNVFDQLLQNEAFCDVTLAVDGKTIKCHQMVIAAASPYFQSIFTENTCRHPIVFLKDVTYTQIRYLLEYVYYGEASVPEDELPALLRIAETLKIKGLVEIEEENTPTKEREKKELRETPRTETRPIESSPNANKASIWPTSPSKLLAPGRIDQDDGTLVIDEEVLDAESSNQSQEFNNSTDFRNYNDDMVPPAPGMVRVVGANGKAEWKRYKQYTKDDVAAAIEEVKAGMSALQASRKYGVPSRTLYDKVKKMGIQTANMQKQAQQKRGSSTPVIQPNQVPAINLLGLQVPQANLPLLDKNNLQVNSGDDKPAVELPNTPISGALMMSVMKMMNAKLKDNGLENTQSTPVSLTNLLRHTSTPDKANGSDSGNSSEDLVEVKEEAAETEPFNKNGGEQLHPTHLLTHFANLKREELLRAGGPSGVPSVLNGGSHHSVTLTPRQDTAAAAPAAPGSIDLSQTGALKRKSEELAETESCKKLSVDTAPAPMTQDSST